MPYTSISSYQPASPPPIITAPSPIKSPPDSSPPSLLKIPQNLADNLRESTLLDVRSLQDQPRTISFKTAAFIGVAAFFLGVVITLILTFITY